MIAQNTPEETPVLVNGVAGKVLIMWTDGTADIRMDDGQTLVDVPLVQITVVEVKVFNSTGLSKWLGCLAHEAAIVAAIPDLRDLDRAHQMMKNAEVSA